MSEFNKDEGMNLTEAMGNATELTKRNTDNIDESELTQTVGGNWAAGLPSSEPITEEQTTAQEATEKPQLPDDNENISTSDEEYTGPGLVVKPEEFQAQVPVNAPKANDLSPETKEAVAEYMKDMDKQIEEQKQIAEQKKAAEGNKDEDDEEKSDAMTKDELERAYNEAVVVIDKTGMGTIIDFTEEERAKLERAKKIRLEEVETVSLQSIKTKKVKKKGDFEKILKRQANIHSTQIVLPASGYTAKIKGCSTYELISLMADQQNQLLNTETKWGLIHTKVEETSIGVMDFNAFLANTAAVDYNVFLYGLLCATYPDDDKIPLKCENKACLKEFEHPYSIKSLIRAEKMSEKMRDLVVQTIDNSHTLDMAKAFHAKAAVSQVKTIKLPVSGMIVEVYVQSAYDFIYRSIKELSENKDPKYNQASVLSSMVNKLYLPDPETDYDDPEYFEIDSAFDIAKAIFTLGDTDILVLTKQGELSLEDLSFEFGLMNVTCPHCKQFTATLPMDLESILFYKYQQAMSTKIE